MKGDVVPMAYTKVSRSDCFLFTSWVSHSAKTQQQSVSTPLLTSQGSEPW